MIAPRVLPVIWMLPIGQAYSPSPKYQSFTEIVFWKMVVLGSWESATAALLLWNM